MSACRICLEPLRGAAQYHPRCLRSLFGSTKVPSLDIEVNKLHTAAQAMAGHSSLSGIQKKVSLNLSPAGDQLVVAAQGGLYILKPQIGAYPAIPENEHATTQLARLCGIDVAPSGLVTLKDGTLAYLVRRFDRLADGRKLRQEDFCQLAEQPPKEKYDGSAELCVRLVRKYASEPLIELRKLYQQLVFNWWCGNGDLHLKNFSLLTGEDGITRLTPAYDLVSTQLVIPDDPLALPVNGKETKLRRNDWLELADYCGLPRTLAERTLAAQAAAAAKAKPLIARSYLPADQQAQYAALIDERSAELRGE